MGLFSLYLIYKTFGKLLKYMCVGFDGISTNG